MQFFIEGFEKGGIFMFPILLCALCALGVTLDRLLYVYFRANIHGPNFMAQVQRLLLDGNVDGAMRLCNAEPAAALRPTGPKPFGRRPGAGRPGGPSFGPSSGSPFGDRASGPFGGPFGGERKPAGRPAGRGGPAGGTGRPAFGDRDRAAGPKAFGSRPPRG